MRAQALLVLALLGAPGLTLACRCEQRPLAEYFSTADVVVMARLVDVAEQSGQRELTFELLANPYKGRASKQAPFRVVTATNSAACGVQTDIGAIYVVFGNEDRTRQGSPAVDTCSGTRVHLSSRLEQPMGFVDVPARFVAAQLNALFGLDVLGEVARHAPRPDDRANESLIGLLDLKALAHGGSTRAYATPEKDARVVGEIHTYDDVVSREIGYEIDAAVVYSAIPGWFRVKAEEEGFGWISADDAGTWFAYEGLPLRRLAYLTEQWSGLVWPSAGAGLPVRADGASAERPREQAVNILENTTIGGMPWFRVEILEDGRCAGGTPKVRVAGWVPGYGRSGKPNAWYYSRGC
ncbi:MAG: hypothetical protein AAGE85_00625 [Pseudomonadota bacterium]